MTQMEHDHLTETSGNASLRGCGDRRSRPMTNDQLAAILAERVMGWTVGPERFMMGGRRWIPRWRFQPANRLEDAFRLLGQVAPKDYATGAEGGGFWARVRLDEGSGEARDSSQARAITLAVARAVRIDIPEQIETPGQSQQARNGPGTSHHDA